MGEPGNAIRQKRRKKKKGRSQGNRSLKGNRWGWGRIQKVKKKSSKNRLSIVTGMREKRFGGLGKNAMILYQQGPKCTTEETNTGTFVGVKNKGTIKIIGIGTAGPAWG